MSDVEKCSAGCELEIKIKNTERRKKLSLTYRVDSPFHEDELVKKN